MSHIYSRFWLSHRTHLGASFLLQPLLAFVKRSNSSEVCRGGVQWEVVDITRGDLQFQMQKKSNGIFISAGYLVNRGETAPKTSKNITPKHHYLGHVGNHLHLAVRDGLVLLGIGSSSTSIKIRLFAWRAVGRGIHFAKCLQDQLRLMIHTWIYFYILWFEMFKGHTYCWTWVWVKGKWRDLPRMDW